MLHNTISQLCGSQIDRAKTGCCHFTESQRPIKDKLPLYFCSPDNILSPDFKVFHRDISKRARRSETTLRGSFLLGVYENLNSWLLNGKQRLKRARNHQHVLRNSCTLLVAITKQGKEKGGIMRAAVALPSIWREPPWPAVKTISFLS